MAKKRACEKRRAQISLESIVFVVLVIAVILASSTLFTQQGREVMGSLFGITSALNLSEGFTPYKDDLKTDDKLALYSTQALKFALEKTSSGERVSKDFCEDFETTQYITPDYSSKQKAVEYISDFMYTGCYLKYKAVNDKAKRFCGLLNVAEMEKLVISEKDLKAPLAQMPEKPKLDIVNGLFIKETISSNKGDICVYYENGAVKIDLKSSGNCKKIIQSNCPTVMCENGVCSLKTFYLPQEVYGSQSIAKQWITGTGDPAYIVYYESFPSGEDSSWHISEMSFFTDVILLGGILNAVPGVFQGLKLAKNLVKPAVELSEDALKTEVKAIQKALQEKVSKEEAQEMIERAERSAMKLFLEQSDDNFKYFKAGLIDDAFIKSLPEGMSDDIIPQVTARIMNELAEKTEQQAMESIPNAIRQILESNKVPKEMADSIMASFDKSARSIIKLSAEDAIAQYTRKQAIRQFFDANILKDGRDLLKEPLKKIFFTNLNEDILARLGREAQEELTKSVKSYADNIIEGGIDADLRAVASDGTGFAWKEIMGTVNKEAIKGVEEGMQSTFKAFVQNIKDPNVIIGVLTGVNPGTKYSIGGTLGFKKILGLNIPVFKPTTAAKSELELIASSISQPGKATGNLLWDIVTRSRLLKYGAAFAIGHQLAIAESMNEKYKANGKDSIVLFQPFLMARNKVLRLNNVDYYINIERGQRYGQRLFFASPCKTDMTMKKTLCSCEIDRDTFVYKGVPFNKGTVPFKMPELVFDSIIDPDDIFNAAHIPRWEKGDVEIVYLYDSLPDEKKINFALSIYPESEIEGEAIGRVEVSYFLRPYIRINSEYTTLWFSIPYSVDMNDGKSYKAYVEKEAVDPSKPLYNFLRTAYVYYYDLVGNVDMKNMVKECKNSKPGSSTQGILESSGYGAKLSVKCIDVTPDLRAYDGTMTDNYCFTPSTIAIDIVNNGLLVLNIAIDIAIGVLTLPAAPVTVPVAGFLTGTVTAWIQREVSKAKNWPMRGTFSDIVGTLSKSPVAASLIGASNPVAGLVLTTVGTVETLSSTGK